MLMATTPFIWLDSILFVLAGILFVAYVRSRGRNNGLKLPPGPRPLPLVGNLFDIPLHEPWLVYNKWAQKYGEITSIKALGRVYVFVNTLRPAKDMFEKRGGRYVERPDLPYLDMMGLKYSLAMVHHPEPWRTGRRIMDQSLRPNAIIPYRPTQRANVHKLLAHLLATPLQFEHNILNCVGSIILSIAYSYEAKDGHDEYIERLEELTKIATEGMLAGARIVNELPFLGSLPGWLPGMGFKASALRGLELVRAIVDGPFERVKEQMHEGTAKHSMTLENLILYQDASGHIPENIEEQIKNTAATIYSVGNETTAGTIISLLQMLPNYPEVQRKVQAEIDAVIGRDRLPEFEDRTRLPYMQALFLEVLRWQPVAPVGLMHATTENDVQDGYLIPKGALVTVNIWAILHDPAVYPDPEEFIPERFLTPDGKFKDDPLIVTAFGFGRRNCPGRHFADATVWIAAVSILSVFNVTKAVDEFGNDVPIDVGNKDGAISTPKEFKCTITPRDDRAVRLIGQAQGQSDVHV